MHRFWVLYCTAAVFALVLISCHEPTASDVVVTPSSIAITAPGNNTQVIDSTTIIVKVTDNSPISRVEFYIDGVIDTTRTLTAPPYVSPWNLTALADSSVHTVYAKAYDAAGNVLLSNTVTVTVFKFTPSNLHIVAFTDSTVILSWQNNGRIVTGFQIQQSTDGNTFTTVDSTTANITTVTLHGTYNGTITYFFRVRAKSATGYSKFSNLVQAMPTIIQWVVYSTANSPLVSNAVNSVFLDAQARLWFATDGGASMFNNGTWTSYTDSLQFAVGGSTSMRVTSITEGPDSSIWFALDGGGLERYNPQSATQWRRYTTPDLPSNTVFSVTAENVVTGDIYCATLSGVGQYTPSPGFPGLGSWMIYNTSNSPMPSNRVNVVSVDGVDHSIWFGTVDVGLEYFNQNTVWTNFPLPAGFNSPVLSIAFNLASNAWIGTSGGISVLNTATGKYTSNYNSAATGNVLPAGAVNAVTTDQHTVQWFGTNGGLVRFNDTTWVAFQAASMPLPSDSVTGLSYDTQGNLWIGTRGGVAEYNSSGFH